MDKDFLEYLYVTGELNKIDSLMDMDINELYEYYNELFPNYPLDNDFFFLSKDEQINALEEAISCERPIIKIKKEKFR